MSEQEEQAYEEGRRSVHVEMLKASLENLGHKTLQGRAVLVLEREQTLAALRTICKDFGDNDWDNNLHIPDIINKHLANHLHSKS